LAPNAALARPAATMSPPSAGPTARATLNAAEFSVMACAISGRGTRSGTSVWNDGIAIAEPTPRANTSPSSQAGVSRSSAVSTAIAATEMALND
jgi:hypothetical protein